MLTRQLGKMDRLRTLETLELFKQSTHAHKVLVRSDEPKSGQRVLIAMVLPNHHTHLVLCLVVHEIKKKRVVVFSSLCWVRL